MTITLTGKHSQEARRVSNLNLAPRHFSTDELQIDRPRGLTERATTKWAGCSSYAGGEKYAAKAFQTTIAMKAWQDDCPPHTSAPWSEADLTLLKHKINKLILKKYVARYATINALLSEMFSER